MISVTEPQLMVLAAAAGRPDGAVLPFPEGLRVHGRGRQLLINGLIKRQLIVERPAREGEPTRSNGRGESAALEITPDGRALVRSAEQEDEQHAPCKAPSASAQCEADGNRDPGVSDLAECRSGAGMPKKQDQLLSLLCRLGGASVAEISHTNGWKGPTVRAAISGLKRKGHAVTRATREDGSSAYSLKRDGRDTDGDLSPLPSEPPNSTRASSKLVAIGEAPAPSRPPEDLQDMAEPIQDEPPVGDLNSQRPPVTGHLSPRVASELVEHQRLLETLRTEFPDVDDETLHDTLEGISDLPATIGLILRSHLQDVALARGLKGRIAEMHERLARFEYRAEKKRRLATSVMQRAEIRKIIEPDFTAYVRQNAPALVVLDEGRIPQEYWKPQPAKLDRRNLLATLQAGQQVAGATLGEPGFSVTVRTE